MTLPAPIPRDMHNAVSLDVWNRGIRILQGNRLGQNDEDHVAKLLELMSPDTGDCILDIGCGFGEVARLMHSMRPDLRFGLLNDSSVQLSKCPVGHAFASICADFHRTGLLSGFFDGAMALYSLCHADLPVALAEAARVVKKDGFLFVYDYVRIGGDNVLMERCLHAHAHPIDKVIEAAADAGWHMHWICRTGGDDTLFRELMGDDDTYDAIFNDLEPVVFRMVRS